MTKPTKMGQMVRYLHGAGRSLSGRNDELNAELTPLYRKCMKNKDIMKLTGKSRNTVTKARLQYEAESTFDFDGRVENVAMLLTDMAAWLNPSFDVTDANVSFDSKKDASDLLVGLGKVASGLNGTYQAMRTDAETVAQIADSVGSMTDTEIALMLDGRACNAEVGFIRRMLTVTQGYSQQPGESCQDYMARLLLRIPDAC